MANDIVKDGKLKANMPVLKNGFTYAAGPDALAAMVPGNGSWQPPKPGDKPALEGRFSENDPNIYVRAMMDAFPPGGDLLDNDAAKPAAKPPSAPKL